jgi:hypothetical protein
MPKMIPGDKIHVKSARGFLFREDTAKIFVLPDCIEFVREWPRYIEFRIWVNNYRDSYIESLNKADLRCGDSYFEKEFE